MKRILIIMFLGSVIMFSCGQSINEKTKLNENMHSEIEDEFSNYLKNFKLINLPISIKGCKIDADGFKQFEGKELGKYEEEYSLAYGQIPTNGNYIAIITLAAADCYLPILTTYKKNGEMIDRKTIAIGGCGSDCGFSCEEYMTINKDYTFYTSDTISSYTCDSLGNETPGTYEYYVAYRKGKLLTNGKIEMGEEIKQPLTGRKKED